jgi:uncharacterized membrane protein YvbJ
MNHDPINSTGFSESNGQPNKFCPRCGKNLPADAQFCGECGFRFGAEGQNITFTAPVQPMITADTTPLKTTDYLILFLISAIPVVGLILHLVWALSSTENVNRRNFCRAYLIYAAIGVVVTILFTILYAVIFAVAFESIGTADVFTHSFPGMIFF